jgi:hypothetical protein
MFQLLERMTPSCDGGPPVVILSGHVAMKVRLRSAIEPFAPVDFASSESDLLARALRPVRFIVIHCAPPFADPQIPVRLRAVARPTCVPIVLLATSRDPAWTHGQELLASGQVDDVIRTDADRVDARIAAWCLHSDRCRRLVEALRLAHESTPAPLHPFVEELLLTDDADLSVTSWAAAKPDSSRFALRRELAREGVNPTVLVNVARMLIVVARLLVRSRDRSPGNDLAFPELRSTRRLLARTMGMSPGDVTRLAYQQGPDAVRDRARQAVGELLRGSGGQKRAGGTC